uniref:Uncharacterized protein n=1 Tax=Anguilla anguilla TaxID=7936 RepID=A0A0E9VBX0_ANGAN
MADLQNSHNLPQKYPGSERVMIFIEQIHKLIILFFK